jgi:hypothetical protein
MGQTVTVQFGSLCDKIVALRAVVMLMASVAVYLILANAWSFRM